MENAGSFDPTT